MVSVNPGKLYHAQRLGGKYKVILAEDYNSAVAHTYYRYCHDINVSNSIYIYNKLNQVMQLAEHNK